LITDASGDQFRTWYTHGICHFIGMDVHDVGDYERPLEPGMAFVIEPGLYIREAALEALDDTPENRAFIQQVRPMVQKYKDLGVPLKTIFAAAPPNLANEPWPRLQDYAAVKEMEVLRVPLRKAMAKEAMDRFLIGLDPARDGASAITLTWGDQSWTTDLRVVPVPR